MKIQIMVLCACTLLAMQVRAQAVSGAPYIAVHGEARQEVVPDVFPLEVTLTKTSTDTAATQAGIEALAKDVLAIVDRMGLEDGDVTISNLTVSPEYDYDDKTEKQVFLGNAYTREINVEFHSLEALKKFIASLPESDSLRIDTQAFKTSRAEALRRGLLDEAIANARATAEALAAGVGRKLGPVHTISNQGFNVRYSESTTLDTVTVAGTALFAPGVVALREGRITLDQDVYIVYALE